MSVLSTEGLRDIDVRGSRVPFAGRPALERHRSVCRHRGRSCADQFKGKRVGGIELATDPDLIEEYLRQGELDIDDIYV